LVFAYVRYQVMIGVTGLEFEPFRDEDRAAPQVLPRCPGLLIDSAIAFIVYACELPFEQAMIVGLPRARAERVRSRLHEGTREAPNWARGDVDPEGLYDDPESWRLEDARCFR
jgi:hypothetical protein